MIILQRFENDGVIFRSEPDATTTMMRRQDTPVGRYDEGKIIRRCFVRGLDSFLEKQNVPSEVSQAVDQSLGPMDQPCGRTMKHRAQYPAV